MTTLWLDFETRSMLNIADCGLDRYAKDDSTEVLMLAWAFDEDEPLLWEPHQGLIPQEVHEALLSDCEIGAWNYNFEKNIFESRLGYPIKMDRWLDPSVLCAYMSLPIKLEKAAKALNIDVTVAKHHLVGKGNPKDLFCKPSKATKTMIKKGFAGTHYFKNWESHPEKWEEFRQYCLQDVRAERAVWAAAKEFNSPITPGEYEAWRLDQRMNARGVWIDQVYVNNAKALAEEESNGILAEIKEQTGLENPNSTSQLLEWLQPRGYLSDSVDKENVEAALTGKLHGAKKISPLALKVLELKQKLGGSAYKKLQSILDRMGPDGRLRDQFVYHGAHTGRWSGRGVQLQNLYKAIKEVSKFLNTYTRAIRMGKKIYSKNTVMQLVAGTIRAAFAAAPGKKLLVGDLAQIESRVLAALAGCQSMIDAYASGLDLYKDFMAWLLKKPISQIDSYERARGKVVILGCGFGMGVDKFIEYAASFGVTLTEKEAKEAVYGFREKYKEITSFWKELDEAVKHCVKANSTRWVRGLIIDGRDPDMLKIKLPSGRYIHYLHPEITLEEKFGRMQEGVSYEAWDQKGRIIKRLYGGLLCENVVQAVARDILLNGMLEAEALGILIIMTIHDEIVGEVDTDSGLTYHDLLKCMQKTPYWAEGMGFILAAEGYEGPYYRK